MFYASSLNIGAANSVIDHPAPEKAVVEDKTTDTATLEALFK